MQAKEELRSECIDKAIQIAQIGTPADKIVEAAKKFYDYIKGEE